jgi:AAA15 family ATPase/GTPase
LFSVIFDEKPNFDFPEVNVLLEYGLCNFHSFKEWASVSFKLDDNCPTHISNGDGFARVLGVKGANASGKSNLLKALSFLSTFCTRSFSYEPGNHIAFDSYADATSPSEFYIEFAVGKVIYLYELSATPEQVVSETIYRTKGKKQKILERNKNEITFAIRELQALKSMNLRSNVSVISSAHQYELVGLGELYNFLGSVVSNVGYGGIRPPFLDLSDICRVYYYDKEELAQVTEFLKACDTGITKIGILERQSDESGHGKQYLPFFHHEVDGKDFYVGHHTESNGTMALFKSLLLYRMVLATGGVLVMDEFDINLHPLLLPKLLDLYLDPAQNKKNAQLIVSSHSTEILDYLGRYRSYLVTKRDNQSFAFRVDEIQGDIVRNDRPMRSAYLEGKIGGVPRV